jgi:hypothetical protein
VLGSLGGALACHGINLAVIWFAAASALMFSATVAATIDLPKALTANAACPI